MFWTEIVCRNNEVVIVCVGKCLILAGKIVINSSSFCVYVQHHVTIVCACKCVMRIASALKVHQVKKENLAFSSCGYCVYVKYLMCGKGITSSSKIIQKAKSSVQFF